MRMTILLVVAGSLAARDRVGPIDFYGGKGIDAQAVLKALPFHEGDPLTANRKREARDAVRSVTGHDATDIAIVCCDPNGDSYFFIGLPGESSRKFNTNPPSTGEVRLSPELLDLQKRIDLAGEAATHKG